jgi:hypothetical protein
VTDLRELERGPRESGGAQLRFDRRLRRALGSFYQRAVRPRLPLRGHVLYNGVIVGDRRLGDDVAPKHWTPEDREDIADYEFALMRGLTRTVRPGDSVVVVGGGLGVTVAHAAKLAGPEGRIVCYEGSPAYARRVMRTAKLNGVEARVRVECATVGAAIGVYGRDNEQTAPILPAKALAACDVLELDCEGAELGILAEMTVRPRVVLVEAHGRLGAPSRAVRTALEGLGYRVTELGVAEPRLADLCESYDVRVLCGERG